MSSTFSTRRSWTEDSFSGSGTISGRGRRPAAAPAGAAAFEQKRPTNHSADQERIAYLQKKIQMKDEVLAELMAEHVALKKDIGEL